MNTTEAFIQSVRDIVIARAIERKTIDDEQATQLAHTKLLYGVGRKAERGVTIFKSWQNGIGTVDIIEVCAITQESWVQLVGTTIHELAHVLGGPQAGHSKTWKELCVDLGFRIRPKAAGQGYCLAMLDPELRYAIDMLRRSIEDGSPLFRRAGSSPMSAPGACSRGLGTRGGTKRYGAYVKMTCLETGYWVRLSRKNLALGAPICPCHNQAMQEAA